MTRRDIQLVKSSFEQVRPNLSAISQLFYGRVFQVAPSIRAMFVGDIRAQAKKFQDMLAVLVDGLDHAEQYAPALHAMGQRHLGYGVTDEQYAVVADALVWAVSQGVDGGMTTDEKNAWRSVLGKVCDIMRDGARQISGA